MTKNLDFTYVLQNQYSDDNMKPYNQLCLTNVIVKSGFYDNQ